MVSSRRPLGAPCPNTSQNPTPLPSSMAMAKMACAVLATGDGGPLDVTSTVSQTEIPKQEKWKDYRAASAPGSDWLSWARY